jgi:hypothetical protein
MSPSGFQPCMYTGSVRWYLIFFHEIMDFTIFITPVCLQYANIRKIE